MLKDIEKFALHHPTLIVIGILALIFFVLGSKFSRWWRRFKSQRRFKRGREMRERQRCYNIGIEEVNSVVITRYLFSTFLIFMAICGTPGFAATSNGGSSSAIIAQLDDYIGSLYLKGTWVKKDYVEAIKWYRRAAGRGDADAEYNLGIMYLNGNGVKKSPSRAIKLLQKSAEQNDISAEKKLGKVYSEEPDYDEALKWYRKAAEQGDPEAKVQVALMQLKVEQTQKEEEERERNFEQLQNLNACLQQCRGILVSYSDGSGDWRTMNEQAAEQEQCSINCHALYR